MLSRFCILVSRCAQLLEGNGIAAGRFAEVWTLSFAPRFAWVSANALRAMSAHLATNAVNLLNLTEYA